MNDNPKPCTRGELAAALFAGLCIGGAIVAIICAAVP